MITLAVSRFTGFLSKLGIIGASDPEKGNMIAALSIALIALAGSIISTLVTVLGPPTLQAKNDAKKSLAAYREPLLAASYELQARLYNILRLMFIEKYITNETSSKRNSAVDSTLYVFAQFFGWMEIIRREVHYLRFAKDEKTRQIDRLLREISEAFLSDQYGSQFMIWRVEQRGLGERMITSTDAHLTCLGYASFIECAPTMQEWLEPLRNDLEHISDEGRKRLIEVQHLLLDLVRQLDEKPERYSFEMREA